MFPARLQSSAPQQHRSMHTYVSPYARLLSLHTGPLHETRWLLISSDTTEVMLSATPGKQGCLIPWRVTLWDVYKPMLILAKRTPSLKRFVETLYQEKYGNLGNWYRVFYNAVFIKYRRQEYRIMHRLHPERSGSRAASR